MPPRGRIGFYSHSAALGLVVLSYAAERGLGFSTFVSAGNRADVSGNDLLQFWEEDPSTDIALLYLEAFGNPRRFARIARRVSYRKPILCVKSARSRAGLETARAHIGAVAQSETAVDVLFRQAGVIRADTLEQLFDVAVLLANQPLPRGDRVSIISNSGGVLTLCADACEANGLRVAGPGVVDLGPLATVGEYEDAVQQAMEHEEVDALIAMYACVGNCDPGLVGRGLRRGVARARRRTGAAKPALLCLMGAEGVLPFGVDEIGGAAPDGHVFPSYRFPESAALALARTSQYADFRRRPGGRIVWYEDADPAAARRAVKAALDAEPGPVVWLEGEPAREILHFFGIRSGGAVQPASSAGRRPVAVEVRSDASFGPLIRLVQEGSPPLVRITPLTDHDAREMVGSAGFAESGMDELLCRVSQMVEELPWLCGMYADTAFDEARAGAGRVSLGQGLTIGFCRSSAPPG
jgi:acyl-CoA synthetase (NDP forming)